MAHTWVMTPFQAQTPSPPPADVPLPAPAPVFRPWQVVGRLPEEGWGSARPVDRWNELGYY